MTEGEAGWGEHVTNAEYHGGGTSSPPVRDEAAQTPELLASADDEVHGRGLHIVGAFPAWGSTPIRRGTWCGRAGHRWQEHQGAGRHHIS